MFALLLSVTVSAAAPRIAAPEWTVTRFDHELASFYADVLARALREHRLEVTTAAEIQSILGAERQRQLVGCVGEGNCLVELSSALGCDALLQVSAAKLDATLTANVKIISASTGKVLFETTAEATSEKQFAAALERVGERAGDALAPLPPVSLRERAWVPSLVGGLLLAVGGASVAGAFLEAAALDHGTSVNRRVDATWGEVLQAGGWSAVGLGGAALVGGLLMLLSSSAPAVVPAVSVGPRGLSLGLTWELP